MVQELGMEQELSTVVLELGMEQELSTVVLELSTVVLEVYILDFEKEKIDSFELAEVYFLT